MKQSRAPKDPHGPAGPCLLRDQDGQHWLAESPRLHGNGVPLREPKEAGGRAICQSQAHVVAMRTSKKQRGL